MACDVALETGACPTATAPDQNAGYHKVTVKVTNVAETGKVTWTVDHRRRLPVRTFLALPICP